MGVPGLAAYLKKVAPLGARVVQADFVEGKRVGVDLAILLNKGASRTYCEGRYAALECLARQVAWFWERSCAAVYVFDGAHPPEKAEECRKRQELREKQHEKLLQARLDCERDACDAEAQERREKLERANFSVTAQDRLDAAAMLRALGVSVAVAAAEAERALAHMQRAGALDLIFTEDIDVLVCGAASYVKDFASLRYEEGAARPATLMELAPLLEGLGCSYAQFVTMAMLIGCDFAPKLAKVGPVTAHKLVRSVGADLRACIAAAGCKNATEELVLRYEACRRLLEYDEHEALPEVSAPSAPDAAAVEAFLASLDPSASEALAGLLRGLCSRKRRKLEESPAVRAAEDS